MSFNVSLMKGRARRNHSASPSSGITYIGSNVGKGSISSIALPAGCAIGDYVAILVNKLSTQSFSLTASTTTQSVTQYTSSGTTTYIGVFGYLLTSTDITNGSIPISSTCYETAIIVMRGVNVTPVNQQSAVGTGPSQRPVVASAASITTTVPNTMLVMFGVISNLGGAATGTWAQQSGFTAAVQDQASNRAATIAYATQAAAGTTGTVSATFDNNNFGQPGAVLIAFAPS